MQADMAKNYVKKNMCLCNSIGHETDQKLKSTKKFILIPNMTVCNSNQVMLVCCTKDLLY